MGMYQTNNIYIYTHTFIMVVVALRGCWKEEMYAYVPHNSHTHSYMSTWTQEMYGCVPHNSHTDTLHIYMEGENLWVC